MSLEMFREDLGKQSEGSPCYVNHMTFYVSRLGTKESQSQIKDIRVKLYGPFPKPGEVDENEIFAEWLANFGVQGWENVYEEDDNPMPYSKAFCRQLFLNKRYWLSLNQALINHAVNFENYLTDAAYEDAETIKKP